LRAAPVDALRDATRAMLLRDASLCADAMRAMLRAMRSQSRVLTAAL